MTAKPSGINNLLVMIQGKVEVALGGTDAWAPGRLNQVLHPGDHVRTGERSRAALYLSSGMTIEKGELSEVEIPPSEGINFRKGLFKIFNREGAGKSTFKLPGATAAVRGTDFLVRVTEDGNLELTVLDGQVVISNSSGTVDVGNHERGTVLNGGVPAKTAVLEEVNNLIQWSLYYPGVLNLDELRLTEEERQSLGQSLNAYRAGDLPQAATAYPWQKQPISESGKAYQAALLLSIGQVQQATNVLQSIPESSPFVRALNKIVAAVKFQPIPSPLNTQPSSSSEWLAESYYQQSLFKLEEALQSALAATTNAPEFGFAWERVAELEFSFGRARKALSALERSLQLSPRNAQAVSLKGFLLAAENRISPALSQFEQAIEMDSALGNAWLGRGLCLIRQGHRDEGLRDLLVAASLESQRSLLHSYLGKAFADQGDEKHALKELALAKQLDPKDPTSWLYSALFKQQQNRINEAIRDLEMSEALNDNRQLYRSRLLLDQDAAVRGANLASIYQDAGMIDVSVREASRAVNEDYANYSAHYFLAGSYNQLQDPEQINLRYETPAVNEYLLANLLSPANARTLSRNVSQQEYSKLFERDGFGLFSSSEYRSRGSWLQSSSLYGNTAGFGYAFDSDYHSDPGFRPNTDHEDLSLSLQLKYELTAQDSFYVQAVHADRSGGDLTQYYDARSTHTHLRTEEKQEPLLLGGYYHEWNPEMHTLVLAGRFHDDFRVNDPQQAVLLLGKNGNTDQIYAAPTPGLPTATLNYHSKQEIYTAEVQQIWQHDRHTLVFGARYQTGTFDARSELGTNTPTHLGSGTNVSLLTFTGPGFTNDVKPDFQRVSGYGYYNLRVIEPLLLSAGIAYDSLRIPVNYSAPPIERSEDSRDQISPKAGFILEPWTNSTIQFAYTRSLGGVSFDQSVRLEPVQVAGLNQAFRSLIPEAVAGTVSAAKFETFGLAVEQKFPTGTYLILQGEILNSGAQATIGAVNLVFPPPPPSYVASGTRETLDFTEKNFQVTLNQLAGDWWSLGTRFRLSDAVLDTRFSDIPAAVTPLARTRNKATLYQLTLFALLNRPSGFFARAEGEWTSQSNRGYSPDIPGDDFWQLNLFAGYRFWRRRAQVQIGILNLTDQNYRLNPLNVYSELPRGREFTINLQLNF